MGTPASPRKRWRSQSQDHRRGHRLACFQAAIAQIDDAVVLQQPSRRTRQTIPNRRGPPNFPELFVGLEMTLG